MKPRVWLTAPILYLFVLSFVLSPKSVGAAVLYDGVGRKLGRIVDKSDYAVTFYSEEISLNVKIYDNSTFLDNGYIVDGELLYDGLACTGASYIPEDYVRGDTLTQIAEPYQVGHGTGGGSSYYYYAAQDSSSVAAVALSKMRADGSCVNETSSVGNLHAAHKFEGQLPFTEPIPFPLYRYGTNVPYTLLVK